MGLKGRDEMFFRLADIFNDQQFQSEKNISSKGIYLSPFYFLMHIYTVSQKRSRSFELISLAVMARMLWSFAHLSGIWSRICV